MFLSDASITARVSAAAKRGELMKIGPRLYTSLVKETPERVVRLHVWDIVRLLFPGLVVGYRTGLNTKPTPEGKIFLVGPYARTQKLPGVTIRVLKGPGPLPGDMPYWGEMFLASHARALLECMSGRRVEAESPTMSRSEIEEFVERRIRTTGENWANEVRDRAREIAPALGLEEEAEELCTVIGAMLGTMSAALSAPAAIARAGGMPFDTDRVERFDRLVDALRDYPVRKRSGV